MTVREKTGRKRYVHFSNPTSEKLRKIVQSFEDSRMVNYQGVVALRVRHFQLYRLRDLADELGLNIDMISGTLKALKRKVSEVK